MTLFNFSQLVDRVLGSPEAEPGSVGAMIDPLTRLPTRPAVVRELKHCLDKAHGKQPVGLIIIDFSNVQGLVENGDTVKPDLLIRLARMLTSRVPDYVVGRMRDREFAVLVPGKSLSEVERVANEVIAAVRSDELPESERRFIATIVGIGYSSRGDCKAPQLMSLADIALHYALATGRGSHTIVDSVPSHRAA
jgi:diguanylate cyclase (GGDEF)-like protein